MLIKRSEALNILDFLKTLSDKKFDIQLQYKLIKIKKALQEEQEIYKEQVITNCLEYFETDSDGKIVINDKGGYKIKKDKMLECQEKINLINKCKVQINDIYLSIDELSILNLTFDELSILEPFIKN